MQMSFSDHGAVVGARVPKNTIDAESKHGKPMRIAEEAPLMSARVRQLNREPRVSKWWQGESASRPTSPAAPMRASIPAQLWCPRPVHTNVAPASGPHLSMLTLLCGYTSALTLTPHADSAASSLLPLAVTALAGFVWAMARYAVATLRLLRSGAER